MDQVKIGAFDVQRVEEIRAPLMKAQQFFPDLTSDMLEAARPDLPAGNVTADGDMVLSFHSYILRTGRYTILVDACCGNNKERPARPAFANLQTNFLGALEANGCRPEDVDFVMCTHLHWDHVGWNTRLVDGQWVPTFPNARYIMARREYNHWNAMFAEGADNMHRYGFEDSIQPIVRAERAVLVDDDHEIDTGVWLEPCHGHSPGHVVVNLESGDGRAVMTGDVIHHRLQLNYPDLSTIADTDPELSRRNRTALMAKHADTGNLLLTAHFLAPSFGALNSRSGGGYTLVS